MSEYNPDVTIFSSAIRNPELFSVQYGGLVEGLTEQHQLDVAIVDGHRNYNEMSGQFTVRTGSVDGEGDVVFGAEYDVPVHGVVRDLTIPRTFDKQVYESEDASFVSDLAIAKTIRNKADMYRLFPEYQPGTLAADSTEAVLAALDVLPGDTVIVKPQNGRASKGIVAGSKQQVARTVQDERVNEPMLVQELVDTSVGVQELGVEGVHNIRIISVGAVALFAVARINGEKKNYLYKDIYGRFISPDNLPEEMMEVVAGIHTGLAKVGKIEQSIIAIDLMRGIDATGEQRDYLCEVNSQPDRISKWKLKNPVVDPQGLLHAAKLWDASEAQLLASLVE